MVATLLHRLLRRLRRFCCNGFFEDREAEYEQEARDKLAGLSAGNFVIATYENMDKNEGRGPMKLIGLFSDFKTAQYSRQGKGIMGRNSNGVDDTNAEVRPVYHSVEQFVMSLPDGDAVKDKYLRDNDPDYVRYLELRERYGR